MIKSISSIAGIEISGLPISTSVIILTALLASGILPAAASFKRSTNALASDSPSCDVNSSSVNCTNIITIRNTAKLSRFEASARSASETW